MKLRQLILLAVIILGPAQFVYAEVVFTNFDAGLSYDKTTGYFINASQSIASQFTPDHTVIFDEALVAVKASLYVGEPGVFVYLKSDSNGAPGSTIERMSVNLDTFGIDGSVKTASSVLHPSLTSGTPYWLVLSTISSDNNSVWLLNSIGDNSKLQAGTSTPGGPWGVSSGSIGRGAFQIDGTLVPEPSTLALIILGGIGLLCRRSRIS